MTTQNVVPGVRAETAHPVSDPLIKVVTAPSGEVITRPEARYVKLVRSPSGLIQEIIRCGAVVNHARDAQLRADHLGQVARAVDRDASSAVRTGPGCW